MSTSFNVLCVGDMIGRPGRDVLAQCLPELCQKESIHFVIANIENSAAGFGSTDRIYWELCDLGIHAFTSGNHIYAKKEFVKDFDRYDRLVRPLNWLSRCPGVGVRYFDCQGLTVAVVNLIGQVFMGISNDPFSVITEAITEIDTNSDLIFVDFHGEASSEKQAMGWVLDGKATAVFGTHTHVMTADERLLPRSTAYITDIGMVGAKDSIIGMNLENSIARFVEMLPVRLEPEKQGVGILNAVKIVVDRDTLKAASITRIQHEAPLP